MEDWLKIGEHYPNVGMAYDIKLKNGKEFSNVLFDMDEEDSYFETDESLVSITEVEYFKRD